LILERSRHSEESHHSGLVVNIKKKETKKEKAKQGRRWGEDEAAKKEHGRTDENALYKKTEN